MSVSTKQIDQLFSDWDKPNSPGCVLAVIRDGAVVYQRAYGMADLERRVPLSTDSVLDLGSVGKQFTAVLIALLEQQGALSLDDPLDKHVPELPAYSRDMTLRHLIHHTSGLRDYCTLMELANKPTENVYFEGELFDLIARQQALNFPPGSEYLYSNSGYLLLGVIASRVTSKSYPDLIREYLLQPLGMNATTFNDTFKRVVPNRALAYSPNAAGGFDTDISFCGGYGDGAIFSTVGDLFRWDQNFYHNQLGSSGQSLITFLETPGKLNSGEATDYAFGLRVSQYRGLRTVSHGGSWAGYRSEMMRFPDQHFSVICLANLGSMHPEALAAQVADLYLADHFTSAPTSNMADALPQSAPPASGIYRSRNGGALAEITLTDTDLTLTLMGEAIPMKAASGGCWIPTEPGWDIELVPQPDGTLAIRLWAGKPTIYCKLLADLTISPELAGAYYSPELDITYRVALDGDQLSVRRGYAPPEPLKPVARDLCASGFMIFEFDRAEGQIRGFDLFADRVTGIRFERQP